MARSSDLMSRGRPAGYLRVHNQLRDKRGPAKNYLCPCGKQAAHWAYQRAKENDAPWPYSDNLDDYLAMCAACHLAMDTTKQRREKIAASGRIQVSSFKKIPCPNGCGVEATRGNLNRHVRANRCAEVVCLGCGTLIRGKRFCTTSCHLKFRHREGLVDQSSAGRAGAAARWK